MKFVSWKATPSAATVSRSASGRAEQRRHDAADGGGAAVHVRVEGGAVGHADAVAVDAHRVHVDAQLAEGEVVALPGVDEGADDRMVRAAGGEAALELGLPGIEVPAADRSCARRVDDVVRSAHEAVQRVHRGTHVARQTLGRDEERRIAAQLQRRAAAVDAAHVRIDGPVHHGQRTYPGGNSDDRGAERRRPARPPTHGPPSCGCPLALTGASYAQAATGSRRLDP